MRLPEVLLAVLAAGCSAPPPAVTVVTPPPAPPPPPVASAEPSSASSATPVAPPPIDPAADTDKLVMAQALCPAAIKHAEGKVLVGCRSCPPFSATAGAPDGKVAVDPDPFYPIEAVHRGAFTAPGADQRAIVFEGCESHAENYGGILLADAGGPGYRARAYFSGVHPASCRPYRRPDGRDLLVCQWSDAHQSTAFGQVFVYDFTVGTEADPIKGWTELVTVSKNDYSVCWGVSPEVGVLQGRVTGFRFEDRNGDKIPDLVIEVEHRKTPYAKALDQKIQKKCKEVQGGDPTIDVPKLLGAPRKDTLDFLFDGRTFKATPATRALLRGL